MRDNPNKTVTIAGKALALRPMERNEMKGVFTDALLMFSFYAVEYMGNDFVLLESKTASRITPVQCKKLTTNLSDVLGKPYVMMFVHHLQKENLDGCTLAGSPMTDI